MTKRFVFPAAMVAVFATSATSWAADAASPSTVQDVNIVSPLTSNGSVPVEATIKGIVKTRANPALTHLGAVASDIVTLVAVPGGSVYEIRSDGSSSALSSGITIPSGRALVLTDVQWTAASGTPGQQVYFQIRLTAPDPGALSNQVFLMNDTLDADGFLTRTPNMTIAVGPGVRLELITSAQTAAYVHGYYLDTP